MKYENSRFDIFYQKENKKGFIEVKGVTLEENGIAKFPDAPTERGAKHLRELIKAKEEGYDAAVLFVIQMEDVKYLHPNDKTDPAFGSALRQAAAAGVQVMAVDCRVTPDSMILSKPVDVNLS